MELHRKIYPGITFSDPTFRVEDAGRYELNIFLNDSQFLFSVIDPEAKEVKHVQSFNFFQVNNQREFTDSVKLILDSEDLFYQPFAKCRVAFYHEHSTLVPSELFDSTKAEAYAALNLEASDDTVTAYDTLTEPDVAVVYALPAGVKSLLEQKFKNIESVHASTPLLRQLLNRSIQIAEPALFVYVQPRVLLVLHAKKRKARFLQRVFIHHAGRFRLLHFIRVSTFAPRSRNRSTAFARRDCERQRALRVHV